MNQKFKHIFLTFIILTLFIFLAALAKSGNLAVLNPKGIIGLSERNLMLTAALLMSLVVVPVFVLTFTIAWKFRAENTSAKYIPDWSSNLTLEFIWWAIPCLIITALATLAWQTSHQLDPFRPIDSTVKPLTVQVVALDWKWLFIYPEQNIASVNYVQFPVNRPVNFVITADAPMNSFWIPQLGGQIYAMAGMTTQLHLMASQTGSFNGVSANISGRGFSDMKFVAKATSDADFADWVKAAKESFPVLDMPTYKALAQPSENNPVTTYSSVTPGLHDTIVMQYMNPASSSPNMAGMDMSAMSH